MTEASVPFPGPEAPSAFWRLRTDEQLARRAAEGDERAFAEIFRRYSDSLYRFCLGMTGSPHDAQDALQNAMVKALRALPGERRQIRLKPWLYKVARNESIEVMRRRRESEELQPEQLPTGSVVETAETRERLRRLLADLDLLPERQRAVLLMRELSGLEFADIGAAYQISAAAARQTLYEARLSLRALEEGREARCAEIRKDLADADGRAVRRLKTRFHLRNCPECRAFGDAIAERRRDLAALAPLPAGAALGLLHTLLGGSGGGGMSGGGVAGTLAPAAQTLAAPAAVKSAVAAALVVASVSAADRSGLVDLPDSGAAGTAKSGGAVSLRPTATRPRSARGTGEVEQTRPPSGGAPSAATSAPPAGLVAGGTQGSGYGGPAPTEVTMAASGGSANEPSRLQGGENPASRGFSGSAAGQHGRPEQAPEAAETGAQVAAEHQAGHVPATSGPPPSPGDPGKGPPSSEGYPAPPTPPPSPGDGQPESSPPGHTGSPPGMEDLAHGAGGPEAAGPS